MKKFSLSFLALVLGISVSFAVKKYKGACEDEPQYIYVQGQGFVPAADMWICMEEPHVPACTYVQSAGSTSGYSVCVIGDYMEL